ncbi:uncharacterized protein RAG0_08348 [Rhynchosporium agropyri]|uniref:Uncharacterized protein n=1 Tax=Rhynchosporium agropyri TaxID=914238 RepID=A0A1E1KQF2_9HELO|nr:uncharacterized protein RAG0_08348 [Rhynchosporium agropyri]
MTIQKRPFSIFLEYVSAERYSRKTILRSSSTLRSKVYSDGGIKTKIFALSVIHDKPHIEPSFATKIHAEAQVHLESIVMLQYWHLTSDAHVYQSTAEPTIDLFIYNIGDLQFNEDARGSNVIIATLAVIRVVESQNEISLVARNRRQ